VVIMGNDYTPDINTNLITAFLLFIMWIAILLTASYYVPRAIVNSDDSAFYSFSSFKSYLANSVGKILLGITLAMIGAVGFLFLLSMAMSYVIGFLEIVTNYSFSKVAIESLISFSTQVFYANTISAVFLNIYINKTSLSQAKPKLVPKVRMQMYMPGKRGRKPGPKKS
jgi:hypothetical protein